jgi:hypothetical protein
MEIEEIFKKWLEDKPMAKILVTENSQMGYILEFAEFYCKSQQEEIQLLNKIIKEAINLPKGIEPHSYSDYKYNNNGK